jgi:hypothetical protein
MTERTVSPPNTQANPSGAKRPKMVGPRAIPASNSPTTGGWPTRFASQPKTLATPTSKSSWTRKTRTSCSVRGAANAPLSLTASGVTDRKLVPHQPRSHVEAKLHDVIRAHHVSLALGAYPALLTG